MKLNIFTMFCYFWRVKNKNKKRRRSKDDLLDLGVGDLLKVRHSGELLHCGTFSWSKRFCVINEKRFLCFKSDRDSKPFLSISLADCTVSYADKEGKRNHILKISHDAGKTSMFSSEHKDKIDLWLEVNLIQLPSDNKNNFIVITSIVGEQCGSNIWFLYSFVSN